MDVERPALCLDAFVARRSGANWRVPSIAELSPVERKLLTAFEGWFDPRQRHRRRKRRPNAVLWRDQVLRRRRETGLRWAFEQWMLRREEFERWRKQS